MASYIPIKILDDVFNICIDKTITLTNIIEETKKLRSLGYSIHNILEQLFIRIIDNDKINDQEKSKISIYIAKSEKELIDGADEYLQLLSILSYIHTVVQNN